MLRILNSIRILNHYRYRSKRRTFLYTYKAAQSEAAFPREIAVTPKAAFASLRLCPMPCENAMNFTFANIPPSTLTIPILYTGDGLNGAALEIGKAERTNFLLRISSDRNMGGEIQRECLKSERWHEFGKDIFIGHGGKLQEDSIEEQYRTLLILNVVLNCIAFWNTLALQQITAELRKEGYQISQEKLSHITPTMTQVVYEVNH